MKIEVLVQAVAYFTPIVDLCNGHAYLDQRDVLIIIVLASSLVVILELLFTRYNLA